MKKKSSAVSTGLRKETEIRLRRIARAGEVFIDGDAFAGVVVDPSLITGDDYSVDHKNFISVKQTLLKLKRLEPGDIGVMAWRKYKDVATIVVPVDVDPNRSVRPGDHPVTPAMAKAFEGTTAVQELSFKGFPVLSVCAPIRDSLDNVVGVVEVFASLRPDLYTVNALDY